MKILFNCLTLKKGGAERVITTLSNYFVENNEVSIITLMNTDIDYDVDERIKIVHLSKSNVTYTGKFNKLLHKISIFQLIKLKNVILGEKPDIIISFLPEPSLKLMLLKKLNRKINLITTIISIRNDPNVEYKNFFRKILIKVLYPSVNGLVLQTDDALKYFKNIINNKDKMIVIPNPINDNFITSDESIKCRDKVIVSVGRLETQKNQKLLIDAFSKVVVKHPDYTLKIYGEGRLREYLQHEINDKNLASSVKLMGQVDNIKDEICKASIFVLSSDYEGMPNALMEAMALGVPCISTDCPCGGPKMLIQDGKNGLLTEVGNTEMLIQKINQLIDNDELLKSIEENAKEISKKYNKVVICNRWLDFINKTLRK